MLDLREKKRVELREEGRSQKVRERVSGASTPGKRERDERNFLEYRRDGEGGEKAESYRDDS
jgi:hypothetical protein